MPKKARRTLLRARFFERIQPESEERNYAGGLQGRVVEHGGEVPGKPVLMGTGLDEKARKELLGRMIKLREPGQKTKKTDDKTIKVERDDKNKTSNMIKDINILRAREAGGKSLKGRSWIKKSNQR